MKKIPIYLSALVLTGVGAAFLGVDLLDKSGVIAQSETESLNLLEETARNLATVYTTANVDPIIANQVTRYVKLSRIDPVANRVTFELEMPDQGWKVRSIKVYYRDYENNITEKVADEKFALTGVEQMNDWGVKLVDRTLTPAMSAPTIGSAVKIGLLTANKTDQAYYAVEFAEVTNNSGREEWSETKSLWVQGKVDYRNCGHSEVYDNKTMACAVRPAADGKIFYTPEKSGVEVTLPAGEVVQSWADEWRELQLERAQAAYKKMDTLRYQLVNATKFIGEATNSLDKIELAVEEVGEDADGLIPYNVRITRELIAKLQTTYAALGVTGDQEELEALRHEKTVWEQERKDWTTERAELSVAREGLEKENEALKQKNDTLAQEKEGLWQQNETLDQEKEALAKELEAVKSQVTTAEVARPSVTYKVVETGQRTETALAANNEKPAVKEVNSQKQEQIEMESEIMKMIDATDLGETVEIPDLGEIETNNNVWWWIIPIILACGMVGYSIKRLFGRKQRS